MGYLLADLELTEPLAPIVLGSGQQGIGIIGRWKGRPIGLHLEEAAEGGVLDVEALQTIASRRFAPLLLAARVDAALPQPAVATPGPALSIAVCTRNRAARLERLLRSLAEIDSDSLFSDIEVLVVDNGSTDSTRETVAGRAGVRWLYEAKPGLNFARNAALREARGGLIAYLDDDVVVDRGWLAGLATAWRSRPEAGGFTGLVLPFRLDTAAQVLFERRGGFSRGFSRIEFRSECHANPLFPVGAGSVGAGCNMAFDRDLLIELGGFDEALDTGAPLPGGGDLDIFYRVLRAGRAMVYEPRYAVFHEHRETIDELQRQYRSWGLGLMAFLGKSRRSDPAMRARHGAMIRWWFADQARNLLSAVAKGNMRQVRFAAAEIGGGLTGLMGEYGRSQARVAAIRKGGT